MLKTVIAENKSIIKKIAAEIVTAVKDDESWPTNLAGLPRVAVNINACFEI